MDAPSGESSFLKSLCPSFALSFSLSAPIFLRRCLPSCRFNAQRSNSWAGLLSVLAVLAARVLLPQQHSPSLPFLSTPLSVSQPALTSPRWTRWLVFFVQSQRRLHTTPCPKCPDGVSIFTELRPNRISEPLRRGGSTTCILTHPTLKYPALKDNVHFAGLIPHRSLDGTVVVAQLQKASADYVLRELPAYVGTVNPAVDVFRPIMRGWRQYNKRDANGAFVPALPYNPTLPFSYSEDGDDEEGNDGEGGSWWTYDGQKLPEQDDDMEEDN